MRDLGAVLDHEEPLPIRHAIQCSSVEDHQRSVVRRRRDERGTSRLSGSRHEAPLNV
jgi:hypothetical protein